MEKQIQTAFQLPRQYGRADKGSIARRMSRDLVSGRCDVQWSANRKWAASRWPSSPCDFQPSDRLFDDRQVDQRRRHAEEHRQPPDNVVGTGHLERPAAEPNAKEASDLMAEEGKAEQHG